MVADDFAIFSCSSAKLVEPVGNCIHNGRASTRWRENRRMLDGCTPWPAEFAQRYRDRGYWQGITLSEMMVAAIRRYPAKTALVYGDLRVSYRALGETVDRLACGFVDAGLAPLDRVVMQLANVPDFVYTYLAL